MWGFVIFFILGPNNFITRVHKTGLTSSHCTNMSVPSRQSNRSFLRVNSFCVGGLFFAPSFYCYFLHCVCTKQTEWSIIFACDFLLCGRSFLCAFVQLLFSPSLRLYQADRVIDHFCVWHFFCVGGLFFVAPSFYCYYFLHGMC